MRQCFIIFCFSFQGFFSHFFLEGGFKAFVQDVRWFFLGPPVPSSLPLLALLPADQLIQNVSINALQMLWQTLTLEGSAGGEGVAEWSGRNAPLICWGSAMRRAAKVGAMRRGACRWQGGKPGGGTALTLMNVSRLSKRTGKVRRVVAVPWGLCGVRGASKAKWNSNSKWESLTPRGG